MKPDNIILECVVGSQLYNLDTPESDIDIKGIFIADPKDFWTLNPPKEVRDHTDPDWAYYELKKFCSLALKMNPTIIELLWTDNYLALTPLGQELKDLRKEFLHQGALNSYLGYAVQQVKRKYRNATDITEYRAGKRARHTWRLCKQYEELATTGNLTPRLTDEQRKQCFEFQELSYQECLKWFLEEEKRLRKIKSVLPEKPNYDKVNEFLVKTYSYLFSK